MAKTDRLISLDVFRGLTIAGMILVNTPGSWNYVYSPLRHADWHGCTPTDLVFPFFLFIVGVAMWFSFKKFDHQLSSATVVKILRRAVLIFLVGLLLKIFPNFIDRDYSQLRILGVLQRIAIAYGIGALLCMWLNQKKLIIVSVVILAGYWIILWAFGGDDPYGLTTNVVLRVDKAILGESHLWQGKGIPFDPEGLLSTLPAIVTVILGYLTGRLIGTWDSKIRVVTLMLLLGIAGIFFGKLWGLLFPINKSLWTSSYVIYTAGYALLLLAGFLWIIDIKKAVKWSHPLRVFGMNPLFIYALSIVWVKILIYLIKIPGDAGETMNGYAWIYQNLFVTIGGNMFGSFLFGITHIILFWFVGWILYRFRIFIKI